MAAKQLYRSRTNRRLTGLCGGIAEYFGWDATVVRIGAVVLELVTAGLLIFAYLIISLLVPNAPTKEQ